MRRFFCLLAIFAALFITAYVQCEELVPPFAIAQFDKDQLLNRLGTLKPFQPEKGGGGQGPAFAVTKEEFRNSLLFLPPERTDGVMKDFGMAVAFSFRGNTQFLILTQWRDPESAKNFMQLRHELWRMTDEQYQSHIKNVAYEELAIAKGEKALLSRKTIEQSGQKQDVTTFVSARETYFFECTLMGSYGQNEVKKLVLQIWKIVEAGIKQGAR
jgi:hypothetical protein